MTERAKAMDEAEALRFLALFHREPRLQHARWPARKGAAGMQLGGGGVSLDSGG
jgi:hypothetical protein